MRLDRSKKTPMKTRPHGFLFNQKRDPQILLALYKMRLLRTRDITKLYFGSKSTAQKRLRKLYDRGYVKCWSFAMTCDNVYTLDKRGKDFLKSHFGLEINDRLYPSSINGMNLDHLFAINSVRINLSLALGDDPSSELCFFIPEWEIRAQRNINIAPIIPDAVFRIKSGEVAFDFALEVDLGGQSPSYFRAHKIRRYLALLRGNLPLYGIEDFTIMVVTTNQRRIRHLTKAALAEGVQGEFQFFTFDGLDEQDFISLGLNK